MHTEELRHAVVGHHMTVTTTSVVRGIWLRNLIHIVVLPSVVVALEYFSLTVSYAVKVMSTLCLLSSSGLVVEVHPIT